MRGKITSTEAKMRSARVTLRLCSRLCHRWSNSPISKSGNGPAIYPTWRTPVHDFFCNKPKSWNTVQGPFSVHSATEVSCNMFCRFRAMQKYERDQADYMRYSSCRYNERQLIDVTVLRRVRPRAEHNVRAYRFLPADTTRIKSDVLSRSCRH